MLVSALMSPELKSARNLILIDRVVEEILVYAASSKEISTATIRSYLMHPYSTPTMMAGKTLFVEGRVSFENEALQL